MGMVLKWNVQYSHMGVKFSCPCIVRIRPLNILHAVQFLSGLRNTEAVCWLAWIIMWRRKGGRKKGEGNIIWTSKLKKGKWWKICMYGGCFKVKLPLLSPSVSLTATCLFLYPSISGIFPVLSRMFSLPPSAWFNMNESTRGGWDGWGGA